MSEFGLSSELIGSIRTFVDALKSHPGILHNPDLGFFREYLQSLGGRIPEDSKPAANAAGPAGDDAKFHEVPVQGEDEVDEPYPELDEEGCVEPDPQNLDQEMGDPEATPSDEDIEKSNELKREAMGLASEGNYEAAIEKYTEAIKLNGGSALLLSKRGQAFLQLGKPNACIKDCSRALQINPDSAAAYKYRGRAHRLLGHWEEAAKDLRQACKIDFDDHTNEWLKEVTPNARKVEEWRLRKKRREEERDLKLRKIRAEERARAHAEARAHPPPPSAEMGDDIGAGAENLFGGIPGLDKLMSDPEVLELFADPEVTAAFNDVGKNPMNILKYQNNPKVAKLLGILKGKMGGGGGFPGFGMPGGFGGFGGGAPGGGFGGADFGGGAPEAPPRPPPASDDLD